MCAQYGLPAGLDIADKALHEERTRARKEERMRTLEVEKAIKKKVQQAEDAARKKKEEETRMCLRSHVCTCILACALLGCARVQRDGSSGESSGLFLFCNSCAGKRCTQMCGGAVCFGVFENPAHGCAAVRRRGVLYDANRCGVG